jgi:lipopolysaccharide/colanic/teichoic acid biosynthesis glycosyltransferase
MWTLDATLTFGLGVAGLAWLSPAVARAMVPAGADGLERLLFVGWSPLAATLVAEADARPDLGWRVLGVVVDLERGETPDAGPWLGRMAALPEIIAATAPTHLILAPAERRRCRTQQTLLDARLSGIAIEDAAEALERLTGKLPIERLTPRTLALGEGFHHSDIVASDPTTRLARVISFVVAATGLVAGAPLFAIVAAAVKLESRGPVLFTQPRLGMNGRSFRLHKFRTMHATETRTSEWVSDNAHRITRVGRWLRRFRIDEWPQLVNVLVGDMNLVGPRPHPSSNGPLFLARIPHYRLRLSVRPGLTGWAQIHYGYANGLEEETEKMRYDLYYIKHRSLALDVKILIATIVVLVFDGRSHERVRLAPDTATWRGALAIVPQDGLGR